METNHVPTKKIRIDGGTQMRAVIDDETVAEYTERYRAGEKMPALIVFYDGENYWLADGFHRIRALIASDTPNALCEIRSGTQREAVLFACGANAVHGIRRTNADKRRAVETMLRDAEWVRWTDRRIANACGVAASFVGDVRKSICSPTTDDASRLVERGGKVYEQSTANIGKRGPNDKPVAPRAVDLDELPVIVAPAREPIMHEAAPAPYREGGAPSPKPAERPRRPAPEVNRDVQEAAISARALCGFMDRASMALNEQNHHIAGFLLSDDDAGALRVSISSLRLALEELEERLGAAA